MKRFRQPEGKRRPKVERGQGFASLQLKNGTRLGISTQCLKRGRVLLMLSMFQKKGQPPMLALDLDLSQGEAAALGECLSQASNETDQFDPLFCAT